MERIQALIDRLNQQAEQGADTNQLLATVQLLQSELLNQQQQSRRLGTSKVAVVMPAAMQVDAGQFERYAPRPQENHAPVQQVVTEVKEAAPEPEMETVIVEEKTVIAYKQPVYQPQPVSQHEIVPDPLNEIPTLSHQAKSSEGQSLNDKLKQVKTELGELLKDSPVKDLRKAIGINDRFVFINDLFRGDEAMYERSIKTINGFNIFPEADYWISRELKVKLGWDAEHPLVLQFDQLVKRRFS
ncbi:MAG: hypothetical protein DI535_13775 [Citrobacter freundii]|nr:MAG: hypothetical protein DI535_13775 [Citrobacter freundii]